MRKKRAAVLCACMAGAALLALGLLILPGKSASMAVIGGADGPTAIFVAGRVSGLLWAGVFGLIAIAAVILAGILLWRGRRGR